MKRATCEGQAELMIAKHRNGNTGNLRIAFDGARSKFTNFDKPIYDSSQPTKNRFFPYNFISQHPTFVLAFQLLIFRNVVKLNSYRLLIFLKLYIFDGYFSERLRVQFLPRSPLLVAR